MLPLEKLVNTRTKLMRHWGCDQQEILSYFKVPHVEPILVSIVIGTSSFNADGMSSDIIELSWVTSLFGASNISSS